MLHYTRWKSLDRHKDYSLLGPCISYISKKMKCCEYNSCGLYYKNITIVNDTTRVVKMMPQFGTSFTIIILRPYS